MYKSSVCTAEETLRMSDELLPPTFEKIETDTEGNQRIGHGQKSLTQGAFCPHISFERLTRGWWNGSAVVKDGLGVFFKFIKIHSVNFR